MKLKYVLNVLLLIFGINVSYAQVVLYPTNLDFEDGKTGALPIGWSEPGFAVKNKYNAFLTTDEPKKGKKCLELARLEKKEGDSIIGAVMQTIDAKPFRGKRIRFRAAICAEMIGKIGSAHLWLQVQKADKCNGFTDFKDNEPIVNTNWRYCEIIGKIDDDAEIINYGLLLSGNGRAWIDDASFEIVDVNVPTFEQPRPLNNIGLENIKAFTKLSGYVRYFYPSSELHNINWNKFIYNGIKAIEEISDTKTMTEYLEKKFQPIAPGIKISNKTGKNSDCGFKIPPTNAVENVVMVRRHIGPDIQTNYPLVSNEVTNIYNPQREREANVYQIINAAPFLGKKIRFSAEAKANVISPAGRGQLGIKIDLPGRKTYSNDVIYNNPIIKNSWQNYSIETTVPQNAENIFLGLILIGDGEIWLDNLKLEIIDPNTKQSAYELRNAGFEESDTGRIVNAWTLPNSAISAGYNANVTTDEKFSGEKSLCISSELSSRILFPEIGQSYMSDLNNSIKMCMPLTSYADTSQTLPRIGEIIKKENLNDSVTFIFDGNDRTSRISIVSTLWNIYRHFGLYDNTEETWNTLLNKYFEKAAIDANNDEFMETLRSFLNDVHDDQAKVWQNVQNDNYTLPLIWKYIGNQLVITYVQDSISDIKRGDIVLEIEGEPIKTLMEENEKKFAGVSSDLKKLKVAIYLKSGDKNSTVKLKIKTTDGKIENVVVKRNELLTDLYEPKQPVYFEARPGIVYVDLTRLDNQTLRKIIRKFEDAKGIIFDLRGLTGVTDFFLGMWASGYMKSIEMRLPVYTMPDHKLVSYKIYPNVISPKNPYLKSKIAFLMDERSEAVSEMILTVAKLYHLGDLVGASSAGMLTDVIGFNISDDFHFSMSGLIGIDPDGNMVNKKVITPTVEVQQTLKGVIEGKDDILEKAIEVLEKQIK